MHNRYLQLLVLIITLVALVLLSLWGGLNQLLVLNFLIFGILAVGINLSYGFINYVPFGYAGVFGIGAYALGISITLMHVSSIVGVLIGGVAGMICGLVLLPLLRLRGAYFAVATLAAAELLHKIVANPILAEWTQGPYGLDLHLAGHSSLGLYLSFFLLLGGIIFTVFLRASIFGRSLLAAKDNPLSAQAAGIPVYGGRMIIWLVSSVIAGLAGAIYALNVKFFYPDTVFDLSFSLFPLIFAILGGVGTAVGPLVGTLLLYGLYTLIGLKMPDVFQLLFGVVVIIVMLSLPGGLVGWVRKRGVDLV